MKPYCILLALFCTLFATAQENTPKREIFGANRVGFYLSLGTGYNTLNKKGLFLTQYSNIGFTFKNRFSVEYSHCFAYRTVKEIGYIRSTHYYYGANNNNSKTKFEAYNANAQGLYNIDMLNAYISLYREYEWGLSFRITLLTFKYINLLYFRIQGQDVNGNNIEYKPENPYTEAYRCYDNCKNTANSGISFDYHLNNMFNIKLDFIPIAFTYDNGQWGMQIFRRFGDDSDFLQYVSRTTQFNLHFSWYFLNFNHKNTN